MGILLGGVDVVQETIQNEFRIGVLERLFELLVQRSGIRIFKPEAEQIRKETLAKLQEKYPDLGLKLE